MKKKGEKVLKLGLEEIFNSPKQMTEQLDAFMFYLHYRYCEKNSLSVEKPNILSFIVTDIEVIFDKIEHVMIRNDYCSRTIFIVSPIVPDEEKETRRLFLLNYFCNVIKNNQLSSIVDLFRLLDGVARKQLIVKGKKINGGKQK